MSIRDSLRRKITGKGDRRVAWQVRYVGFPEVDDEVDSGMWSKAPKRRTKGLVVEGSHFTFRQKRGGKSQWVTVHNPRALEAFEQADNFEIRRPDK